MNTILGNCLLCKNNSILLNDPTVKTYLDLASRAVLQNCPEELLKFQKQRNNQNLCVICIKNIQVAHDLKQQNEKSFLNLLDACLLCGTTKDVLVKTDKILEKITNMGDFMTSILMVDNLDDTVLCISCIYNLRISLDIRTELLQYLSNNNVPPKLKSCPPIEQHIRNKIDAKFIKSNETVIYKRIKNIPTAKAEIQDRQIMVNKHNKDIKLFEQVPFVLVKSEQLHKITKPNRKLKKNKLNKRQEDAIVLDSDSSTSSNTKKIAKNIISPKPSLRISFKSKKNLSFDFTPKKSKAQKPAATCKICDETFQTVCSYKLHMLKHEKFDEVRILLPRCDLNALKLKTNSKKIDPPVPLAQQKALLKKYLNISIDSDIFTEQEETDKMIVDEQEEAPVAPPVENENVDEKTAEESMHEDELEGKLSNNNDSQEKNIDKLEVEENGEDKEESQERNNKLEVEENGEDKEESQERNNKLEVEENGEDKEESQVKNVDKLQVEENCEDKEESQEKNIDKLQVEENCEDKEESQEKNIDQLEAEENDEEKKESQEQNIDKLEIEEDGEDKEESQERNINKLEVEENDEDKEESQEKTIDCLVSEKVIAENCEEIIEETSEEPETNIGNLEEVETQNSGEDAVIDNSESRESDPLGEVDESEDGTIDDDSVLQESPEKANETELSKKERAEMKKAFYLTDENYQSEQTVETAKTQEPAEESEKLAVTSSNEDNQFTNCKKIAREGQETLGSSDKIEKHLQEIFGDISDLPLVDETAGKGTANGCSPPMPAKLEQENSSESGSFKSCNLETDFEKNQSDRCDEVPRKRKRNMSSENDDEVVPLKRVELNSSVNII